MTRMRPPLFEHPPLAGSAPPAPRDCVCVCARKAMVPAERCPVHDQATAEPAPDYDDDENHRQPAD